MNQHSFSFFNDVRIVKNIGYWFFALLFSVLCLPLGVFAQDLSDHVVVRRTAYGVPHIYADNLRAAGYAMGYVQLEDYGDRVVNGLVRARGEWGKYNAVQNRERQIDSDAASRRTHARAVETYPLLTEGYRDILDGFARGVNRYIELHPEEFQGWVTPNFTGQDVHATGIGSHSNASVEGFLRALKRQEYSNKVPDGVDHPNRVPSETDPFPETLWARLAVDEEQDHPDDGSNVWAFAPSRTTSGKAILMRNPHLSWSAGYYEAHVVVPGKLDFYGDFRIGSPIGIVCGFNRHLGWSTTNNYTDTDEIYAFELASDKPDHYLLDGIAHPLLKAEVTVESKTEDGLEMTAREFVYTPYGPVIHRDHSWVYVIRAAEEGEYRSGEQFLKMMMASSLEEWKDAMRINARSTSNFTYADAAGNIFYVWNAKMPDLPHPSGGDTTAIFVKRSDQIWSTIIPWDNLPQLLNPKGGYLRNENDPFHHTNLHEVFDADRFPSNFSRPQLRLRSQLSLELIGGDEQFSLEEVVSLKHNMKALLADRVKDDLIAAVRNSGSTGELADAAAHLERWDNTVAADSRGGVLFETWWSRYVSLSSGGVRVASTPESAGYAARPDSLFVEAWSLDRPASTPRGLASHTRAVEALVWAIQECKTRYGGWDLAWGDVHRARIGSEELPVGGGAGNLGCFRVLTFTDHQDDPQKLEVSGGDGWVLAVEFAEVPRAYSILAYGQSNKADSPHHDDQLELFSSNQMKPVAFTDDDVRHQLIREYRPGKLLAEAHGQTVMDILVKDAWVFDGAGLDSTRQDVGISGDRIAYVGPAKASIVAKRIIDGTGLYLAPGFIDPHTHYNRQLSDPDSEERVLAQCLMQGVTTVFMGNDGSGPLPIGETLTEWENMGVGVNVGLFAPHGTIRTKVLGYRNIGATSAQLEAMKGWMKDAMEEGAFGLSTGLFYTPGFYAGTDEVVELAKIAAAYGGIYDTHQRDEGSQNIGVIKSVEEVLEIGRKAEIPVHISHIKVIGTDSWGKSREIVSMVDHARREGIQVTANQYPYLASSTSFIAALVPSWARDGGTQSLRQRLGDPMLRDSIRMGVLENIRHRGTGKRLVISGSNDVLKGKSLADIATMWNVSEDEAVIRIVAQESPSVHSFSMDEDDLLYFMRQPWVMVGSDASSGHPRAYGSFAKFLRSFVKDGNMMSMAEGIHKCSGLTAQVLNIAKRGFIKEGYYADIVLFDPDELQDNATYDDSRQLASGVSYVMVNGQLAVDQGVVVPVLSGKALRRNKP